MPYLKRILIVIIRNVTIVKAKKGIETPMQGGVLRCIVPHMPLSNQFRHVSQTS